MYAPETLKSPEVVKHEAPDMVKSEKNPSYREMIFNAITYLNEKTGSSRMAILKHVIVNNNVDPQLAKRYVRRSLADGVAKGFLMPARPVGKHSGKFLLGCGVPPGKADTWMEHKAPAVFKYKNKAKPSYREMIFNAIADLNEKTGSSRQAILKHVIVNNNVDAEKAKRYVRRNISDEVAKGFLKPANPFGKNPGCGKLIMVNVERKADTWISHNWLPMERSNMLFVTGKKRAPALPDVEKSEYEKIRDSNIKEREGMFSALVADFADFKKDSRIGRAKNYSAFHTVNTLKPGPAGFQN